MEILSPQVRDYLIDHAAKYGLDAASLRVEYVLNWGGFVNASFTLSDGHSKFHLKLAGEEHSIQRLLRWKGFHRRLEERYHAPQLLDWVEIPGTPYAGLLFEHVPGRTLTESELETYLPALLENLSRLSADRELAQELISLDGPRRLADFFVGTYIERFRGDLEGIRAAPPAFLDAATLDWMAEESRRLEDAIQGDPDFAAPASAAVHGDLWSDNVLLTPAGKWVLLDWDDLALGDPACDYVLLTWSLIQQRGWEEVWAKFPLPDAQPGITRRIPLYLRAHLLDGVIDSLADYVEAEAVPEHRQSVQEAKRQVHQKALARYRTIYMLSAR